MFVDCLYELCLPVIPCLLVLVLIPTRYSQFVVINKPNKPLMRVVLSVRSLVSYSTPHSKQ